MSRSLLVAGLLAALFVCSAFAGDADEPTANTEYYKKRMVDPPVYTAFSVCEGPTTEVTVTSPTYLLGNVDVNGIFRSLNVSCSGAATCVKSGPDEDGCEGSTDPYAPGGGRAQQHARGGRGRWLHAAGRRLQNRVRLHRGLPLLPHGGKRGSLSQTGTELTIVHHVQAERLQPPAPTSWSRRPSAARPRRCTRTTATPTTARTPTSATIRPSARAELLWHLP